MAVQLVTQCSPQRAASGLSTDTMKYRKRIGTLLNATTESNTRSHAGAGSVDTENSGNEQTDSTRDAQTGIYRRGAQRQACHIQPRKSSAQRVYEQSGDIYLVQELLGHRSVSTTQKYLGVNYATAREFVEAIAIGYERDESRKTSRSSIQDVHIFPKPCKDHNSKTKYAKDTDIYYTGHF